MASGLAAGCWLLAVYDGLRLFRLLVPHGELWRGIEDFLYWMYAGVTTFGLLYRQNGGQPRAYMIGSVLAGMICYDLLISRFVFKLLKKLAEKFRIDRKKQSHRPSVQETEEGEGRTT